MNQLAPVFTNAALRHTTGICSQTDAANTVISEQDYATAFAEITEWQNYQPTPLHRLTALANVISVDEILYKDEGPRFGIGSFKALGGAYAALRVLQQQVSVQQAADVSLAAIRDGQWRQACEAITLVSATDGNHGRSLAWGCQRFGNPCRIYIHEEVSEGRAEVIRGFGAEVVRIDGDYDASVRIAREEAEANGWFVVSDTSWPGYTQPPTDVMAGYGVMTREVVDVLDSPPTHVFLQGGVGGLAAGVAASLRQLWGSQSPRVVVVEPELAPCLFESARLGAMHNVVIEEETIMAGLSCGEPSPLAWQILSDEAADFVTIPDSLIPPTVRLLARPLDGDPVVESGESGVAGLAALILARQHEKTSALLGLDESSRVLLIGSEGITDPDIYQQIMDETL